MYATIGGVSQSNISYEFKFRYDYNTTLTNTMKIITGYTTSTSQYLGIGMYWSTSQITNNLYIWNLTQNNWVYTGYQLKANVWYSMKIILTYQSHYIDGYVWLNDTAILSGSLIQGYQYGAVTSGYLNPTVLQYTATVANNNFVYRMDQLKIISGYTVPPYEQPINYYNTTWDNSTHQTVYYNNSTHYINNTDWVNYTNWINSTNANIDYNNQTFYYNNTEYHYLNNSQWQNYTQWLNITSGLSGGNNTYTGNVTSGGFNMESGYLILLIIFTALNIIGYFKMPILQLIIIVLTLLVSVVSLSTFGDDYLIPFSFILINIVIGVIGIARGFED